MAYSVISKIYPRARDHRVSVFAASPALKASRRAFFRAAVLNFAVLQLLFLGLFCYLFGSLFQQTSRTSAIEILWVDYDRGAIGQAVRNAYETLSSNSFPTLVERPIKDFPTQRDLKEAVCNTQYWAALFTSPGASERLERAITGASSVYNQTDVLAYIWNEARYPTVVDSVVSGSLQVLSGAARASYTFENSVVALSTVPIGDSNALFTFANPWMLSSINIQPTIQGTRAVYNTMCIVLVLIQDFFYLGSINGLYTKFQVYNQISPIRIILTRYTISTIFTMTGSLLTTAAIWVFKAGWDVSGKQFVLNWLIIWLFAHVNFLVIDIFTIWVPPQYVPMVLISWIVTNVTSILIPFSLTSPFYRWAYALPAHEAYELLTDNWSGGCNPHIHFGLPILLAYEIIGLFFTSVGVYRRCHFAVKAREAAEEAARAEKEPSMMHHVPSLVAVPGSVSRLGNSDMLSHHSIRSIDTGENGTARVESKSEKNCGRNIVKVETDHSNALSGAQSEAIYARNFGPNFAIIGSSKF